MIGTDHPDDGEGIIERAHGHLLESIFDLGSDDGPDLVEAFWPRVRFRGLDAARIEVKFHRRHPAIALDDDGEMLIPQSRRLDGGAGSVEVSHLLSRIADPRKRLAFRLFMEGMRVRKGEPCVATACGCDPKTAAAWIAEARAFLATELEIGARHG